ncbi:MAG: leucyl/phenylalanyl-tRNA--protein transferase [Rectinema sp.]
MRWLTMPEYLDETGEYRFPPATSATQSGIVGYGGNLSPGALLSAYRQGIFPWPSTPALLRWCSPNPRFIISQGSLYITESARKSLKKALRRGAPYTLTLDKAFSDVINNCATVPRPGQPGTWIFPNLVKGYTELHRLGYAHSVEVWKNKALVGGLYGVSIGAAFFGESMFSLESNASKIGFLSLAATLFERGFTFVDCQVYTPYLALMGGLEVPRPLYLSTLNHALAAPTLKGNWSGVFPDFPDTELVISFRKNSETITYHT